MVEGERVVEVGEVPTDGSYLYRVEEDDGEVSEAILLRVDGGVVSWLNYCRHMTHIRLDKGSGATDRNGEIVCTNHGAMFEMDTGRCTYGPCEGAVLESVQVAIDGTDVVLTDPDYAFVGTGPIPRKPADLSSTSNLEF